MKENIILIGGGGHCRACIDVIESCREYRICGIVDTAEKMHQEILGYEIIATDEDIPRLVHAYPNFLVTLGQIHSPDKRMHIFNLLKKHRASLPVIVSPWAQVSRHAEVSEGTIVMHHALINSGVRIGKNCIINSKALIEHDARIGDHCHISTGAVVNGGVKIETASFVGSCTMLKEGVTIGGHSIIGAGSSIFGDVPPNSIVKNHGHA